MNEQSKQYPLRDKDNECLWVCKNVVATTRWFDFNNTVFHTDSWAQNIGRWSLLMVDTDWTTSKWRLIKILKQPNILIGQIIMENLSQLTKASKKMHNSNIFIFIRNLDMLINVKFLKVSKANPDDPYIMIFTQP